MIRICIEKKNQRYHRIEVSGHAGYAEAGQDIVCAGVSALLGGMLNGLDFYLGDSFEYRIDPKGFSEVLLPGGILDALYVQADAIVKSFELGVKMVREDHPDCVVIREEEVDSND